MAGEENNKSITQTGIKQIITNSECEGTPCHTEKLLNLIVSDE